MTEAELRLLLIGRGLRAERVPVDVLQVRLDEAVAVLGLVTMSLVGWVVTISSLLFLSCSLDSVLLEKTEELDALVGPFVIAVKEPLELLERRGRVS